MSIDDLRSKLIDNGWAVKELPIRTSTPDGCIAISKWKLIAVKGDRSFEVTESDLEIGMKKLGQILGLLPRTL